MKDIHDRDPIDRMNQYEFIIHLYILSFQSFHSKKLPRYNNKKVSLTILILEKKKKFLHLFEIRP